MGNRLPAPRAEHARTQRKRKNSALGRYQVLEFVLGSGSLRRNALSCRFADTLPPAAHLRHARDSVGRFAGRRIWSRRVRALAYALHGAAAARQAEIALGKV